MAHREDRGKMRELMNLVEEFGMELVNASQVRIDGVDNRVCRLLKLPEHNVYLLEMPALIRYACFPHICGEPLLSLFSSQSEFLRAVISQFSLERFGKPLKHGKLADLFHLPYAGVEGMRGVGDTVLISSPPELSPDSLHRIAEELGKRGGRLRVIFAMGFLSLEDIRELDRTARSLGADTIYLSFLLLGRRAIDGEIYLYGYDLGALRRGELRGIGSILDEETFSKLVHDYPPSTDLSLTNGRLSGSSSYLRSSLERMLLLLESPLLDSWQMENLLREAKSMARGMRDGLS